MAQHGWALEVELVDTSIAERRHGVTEQCVRSVRVRFRVQLNRERAFSAMSMDCGGWSGQVTCRAATSTAGVCQV